MLEASKGEARDSTQKSEIQYYILWFFVTVFVEGADHWSKVPIKFCSLIIASSVSLRAMRGVRAWIILEITVEEMIQELYYIQTEYNRGGSEHLYIESKKMQETYGH